MGTHQRAERAWYGGCHVGTSTKVHLSTGLFIFHFPTGGVPICHIPVHTRACVGAVPARGPGARCAGEGGVVFLMHTPHLAGGGHSTPRRQQGGDENVHDR